MAFVPDRKDLKHFFDTVFRNDDELQKQLNLVKADLARGTSDSREVVLQFYINVVEELLSERAAREAAFKANPPTPGPSLETLRKKFGVNKK